MGLPARLTAFCLLALLVLLQPTIQARASGAVTLFKTDLVYAYSINITYTNLGPTPWRLSDLDVAFGLFINNSWQEVRLIWTSSPVEEIVEDEDGNLWAVLDVPDRVLEPGEALTLSAKYEIVSRPREAPEVSVSASGSLSDISADLRACYCGRAACWPTGNRELRSLALSLAANHTNVLEIVAAFISWIYEHIRYSSLDVPRYPNETYAGRAGDCDDQANLLITLCRIVGIPAYLQIGCIYLPSPAPSRSKAWGGHYEAWIKSVGWHGWAVVYVPPWGWLPVDLTMSLGSAEDPLSALTTAVIWSQHTILAREIRNTDYVGLTRAAKKRVMNSGLYIREEEALELVEEVVRPEYVAQAVKVIAPYLALTMAVLAITALAVGLVLVRRKHEHQYYYPGYPALGSTPIQVAKA